MLSESEKTEVLELFRQSSKEMQEDILLGFAWKMLCAEELVRHCATHSETGDCGYKAMTNGQKNAFNRIVTSKP